MLSSQPADRQHVVPITKRSTYRERSVTRVKVLPVVLMRARWGLGVPRAHGARLAGWDPPAER